MQVRARISLRAGLKCRIPPTCCEQPCRRHASTRIVPWLLRWGSHSSRKHNLSRLSSRLTRRWGRPCKRVIRRAEPVYARLLTIVSGPLTWRCWNALGSLNISKCWRRQASRKQNDRRKTHRQHSHNIQAGNYPSQINEVFSSHSNHRDLRVSLRSRAIRVRPRPFLRGPRLFALILH